MSDIAAESCGIGIASGADLSKAIIRGVVKEKRKRGGVGSRRCTCEIGKRVKCYIPSITTHPSAKVEQVYGFTWIRRRRSRNLAPRPGGCPSRAEIGEKYLLVS